MLVLVAAAVQLRMKRVVKKLKVAAFATKLVLLLITAVLMYTKLAVFLRQVLVSSHVQGHMNTVVVHKKNCALQHTKVCLSDRLELN